MRILSIYPFRKAVWSIGSDQENVLPYLRKSGFKIWPIWFNVYSFWWNQTPSWMLKMPGKKFLFLSNFVSEDSENWSKLMSFDSKNVTWICPSSKQMRVLSNNSLKGNISYLPILVSSIYLKDPEVEKGSSKKLRIGNFMRDSTGANLFMPKWQKNPDLFIDIVRGLDFEKFEIILAGPRRHYIRRSLEELDIPYTFVGYRSEDDDLGVNSLPEDHIHSLICSCDVILVTSESEGGPKAIPEALLTKTHVLSTDVGHARDYLPNDSIFSTSDEARSKLVERFNFYKKLNEDGRRLALKIQNEENYLNLLKDIICR